MKLKWKKIESIRQGYETERYFAHCADFHIEVDYDNDAAWTYTIDYGVWTVREFGDYIRSFGTADKAKEAAEKWLFAQITKMQKAFKPTRKKEVPHA